MKTTVFERILIGLLAAGVAAAGAVIWLAADYYWRGMMSEGVSLTELLGTVWFIPAGCAAVAFIVALRYGMRAFDFALEVWRDMDFW